MALVLATGEAAMAMVAKVVQVVMVATGEAAVATGETAVAMAALVVVKVEAVKGPHISPRCRAPTWPSRLRRQPDSMLRFRRCQSAGLSRLRRRLAWPPPARTALLRCWGRT